MEKLTLGDRIKFIRNEQHLTQLAFGKMLKPAANKSVVSRWESNTNVPGEGRLKQIAKMGDVTVDYLKTGNIDKTELRNAVEISDTPGFRGVPSAVLNNDSFEARITNAVNTRIIETESREAIKRLTTGHYERFKKLTVHGKSALWEAIKLIYLFESDSIGEDNNEYSSKFSELLSQINVYAKKHSVKNKNAVNTATEDLLESLKDIDI